MLSNTRQGAAGATIRNRALARTNRSPDAWTSNERRFCDRSMAEGRANTGAPANRGSPNCAAFAQFGVENRGSPNCAAFAQFGVEEAPLLRFVGWDRSPPVLTAGQLNYTMIHLSGEGWRAAPVVGAERMNKKKNKNIWRESVGT